MKRVGLLFVVCLLAIGLCACGNQLSGHGYQLVDDDGTYVTYRLKCPSCDAVYGTEHMIPLEKGQTFQADLMCDNCFENISLSITRK